MKAAMLTWVLVMVLGACSAAGAHKTSGPLVVERETPTTAKACAAQGGTWKRMGLVGSWQCELRLSDGGKSCRSNADCQGVCLAPQGAQPGQKLSGQCAAVTPLYGCFARVSAGEAEPMLCVD